MTKLYDAAPFIIAEVGSNWHTLDHCLASITAAKVAGADAVKFQAFHHDALYGFGSDCYNSLRDLPTVFLPILKAHADVIGIEFMCTAFSPELVAAVNPYVSVHKVASSDLAYPQLLKAVARTKKPVLLSVGASDVKDIGKALAILPESPVVMYCVASYPARMINLQVMEIIRDGVCGLVGFSDHSTDIIGLPFEAATKYRAVAIEKHVTAFPELDTPDRPHSLTMAEFKVMVDHIRGRTKTKIGPCAEERDMLLRHNRRLIATRDIEQGGEFLFGENFGAYRSLKDDTRGASPFDWEKVEKMRAGRAIAQGDSISLEDLA